MSDETAGPLLLPSADTLLSEGSELVMLGSAEQRQRFQSLVAQA